MRLVNGCTDGKPTQCQAGNGNIELCNNLDDDCDDLVDEDLGTTTCGLGACRVEVANCTRGFPSICIPTEPAERDVCNDIDDDCDGIVDGPGSEAFCPPHPNMIATCNKQCSYSCVSGFADADQNLSNGCEIDLMNDVNNCGSVGNVCSAPSSPCQQASCSAGTCTPKNRPVGTQCYKSGPYGTCATDKFYAAGTYTCDDKGACNVPQMSCSAANCATLASGGCRVTGTPPVTPTCPVPFNAVKITGVDAWWCRNW